MINRQLLIGVVSVAALFVTGTASAASAAKIDREVTKTLELFAEEVKGAEEFLNKSAGYLVFPKVYKVGVGVGVLLEHAFDRFGCDTEAEELRHRDAPPGVLAALVHDHQAHEDLAASVLRRLIERLEEAFRPGSQGVGKAAHLPVCR